MGPWLCADPAGNADRSESAHLRSSGRRRLDWICGSRRTRWLRLHDESDGCRLTDRSPRRDPVQRALRSPLSVSKIETPVGCDAGGRLVQTLSSSDSALRPEVGFAAKGV